MYLVIGVLLLVIAALIAVQAFREERDEEWSDDGRE